MVVVAEGMETSRGVRAAVDHHSGVLLAFLPSPESNGIQIGPVLLHAYGLCYVVAIVAAVMITSRRWKAQGGDPTLPQEVAIWGVPAGLIGGRLYFLATSWNEVPDHWWGPLAIWKGGLGIWGGIFFGVLGGPDRAAPPQGRTSRCSWTARRRGCSSRRRSGGSATGSTRSSSAARRRCPGASRSIPQHRPAGYAHYATFHPTFLYELIWNLALAAFLVVLGRKRDIRPPGIFALYVAGYSFARIGEELLRTDPSKHILGLRLNFFVALVLCVGGLVWFWHTQRAGRDEPRDQSPGRTAARDSAAR